MNSGQSSILIIGAGGFIGKSLVRYFSAVGYKIFALIKQENEKAIGLNIKYITMTLPDDRFQSFLNSVKPEFCVVAAGPSSVDNSFQEIARDFSQSADLSFFILNSFKVYSPYTKVLFLSSAAVYGNPKQTLISEEIETSPISPYGFHKLISELICREFAILFGLKIRVLRIFSAYGEGLKRQVIWDIFKKAYSADSVILKGTGDETRDFIYIEDLCKACLFLAELPESKISWTAEIFNVASGKELSIKDVCLTIKKYVNKEFKYEFSGHTHLGNPQKWQADMSKMRELGFFADYDFNDGIKKYSVWAERELLLKDNLR